MLSLTLIYLQLFFPDSLNLLAHSLSLCHPQFLYFFIWIFSPSHSHPVHNSSPDLVFLYHIYSPEMEMEIVIFYLYNQNYWTVSPSFALHCIFFSQLSNKMGNREENWGEQNKNKLQGCIKIQPITDRMLLFQKYYPYTVNYVACGRFTGWQKQLFHLKSHTAK